ncbi:hypothetical protein [Dyadobacter luticola]|uniref:Uncharacterized protein n=1 Tax=Dyadobacter luticola TaxID=1979387 RepID=A0A5R9KX96_9BACT|nr:hypothetical protein [Dyadobacter luticola]TLV00874.1 hypothetical protein FEN17_15485 [Dyadobacter luticola]
MKRANQLLIILGIACLAACVDKVDPEVKTFYIQPNGKDTLNNHALSIFYDLYSNTEKNRDYYEVISKADFIINYYPAGKLLTICYDNGSGWGEQYKNVDEAALRRIADLKIKLNDLTQYVSEDNVIDHTESFINIKSNGKPNGILY